MTRIVRPWPLLLAGLLASAGCPMKLPEPQAAAGADAGGLPQSDAGNPLMTLPPDPGEAGLATIAGIDSDKDGVRDDVQRFVALTFPDSQRTEAALLQLAKSYQAWIEVPANDVNAAYAASEKNARAMECLFAVTTTEKAYAARIELKLQALNTDARQDNFFATDKLLSGGVFETTPDFQSGSTCEFNPQALPN